MRPSTERFSPSISGGRGGGGGCGAASAVELAVANNGGQPLMEVGRSRPGLECE